MVAAKISACLMTKNEAANIARCIGSIKRLGVVDEILILDTGSTDNTPQIATEAGAKVRILENPDDFFIDTKRGRYLNFSKARNESMVGATGDWLLLMDADEDVIGDASELKAILDGLEDGVEGITLQFIDRQQGRDVMRFQSARIFRNGKVHFEGVVHNRPIFKLPAYSCQDIKLEIHHYGYDLSEDAEQKKWNRTVGLLEYRLEKNPEDAAPLFYLSQSWAHRGEHQKSIDYAIRYIAAKDKLENFNPSIYFTLLMELKKANEPELMDKWLAEALRELPADLDIAAATIEYGEWQQKAVALKLGAEKYLRNYEALKLNPLSNGTRFIYTKNDWQLARALFHYSLMSINDGMKDLRRLYDLLEGMEDKKYAKTCIDDLDTNLKHMNLTNWRRIIGRGCKVLNINKHRKRSKKKKGKR